MPLDHDAYIARRFFGSADGWRCLSVLGVVWHHCRGSLRFGHVGDQGYLGVAMFFVLSGFLIMTLLLRELAGSGTISLRSFYARRTLRIMPLYFGVIAATAFVVLVLLPDGPSAKAFREGLPWLLTYTTNWVYVGTFLTITWSLSAEEQFYLVAPAIRKWLPAAAWVFVGLLVLQELLDFGLLDAPMGWIGFGPNQPYMLRGIGFAPILMGVVLAHVLHDRTGFRLFARAFGGRWTPLVLLVALLAILELAPAALRGWPKLAMFLLMTLLIGSTVVREDHVLARPLQWWPVARIGVISYGVYLLHLPVQIALDPVLRPLGVPDLPRFVVILAGTLAAAELSYRFYETPFLRLKARFSRQDASDRASARS